ncbi:DUF2489 domain-containing protein [Paraglaciecola arctica]|uniref:DUF2489 domain-containing protein n=1 Tax=Paraglaciecola arctica TaxID=1128911 RepID=UPI001C064BAC|nr:DUF2489 domain-containing protein [Paraglaciecola arctica]MBU3003473.1 DUF2489 domain-containing protein [Paraglaciecola arctica]
MNMLLLLVPLIIIATLAFYAGSLLFKLKLQQQIREQKTQQRIENICQSIQTIAKAMEQQQCNLSEGSIRLYHLLEALPIKDKPNFGQQFPILYSLYDQIKMLPTHEARKAQSKIEIRRQDTHREELEAKLETQILIEISILKTFNLLAISKS